jgi:hypothetical protein
VLNQLNFEDEKTIVAMIRHIVGYEEVLSNSQVQHIAQLVEMAYGRGQTVGLNMAKKIVFGEDHD